MDLARRDDAERNRLSEAAAWRVAARTVLLVVGIVAAVWLVYQLRGVVIQVLLAVILAAGMEPLVDRFTQPVRIFPTGGRGRTWRPPRALVVLILYVVLVLAIAALGALVIPPAASEAQDLVRGLPAEVAAAQLWLAALPERYPFLATLGIGADLAQQAVGGAAQLTTLLGQAVVVFEVALGLLGGALNGIFILVLALYMTEDRDRIMRYLLSLFPVGRRDRASVVAARIGLRLGGWLRGQLMLSAIIGALTLVGLSVIGVRYAVLLALVAAIGEAIPLIGPILSAVPAVIVASFDSPGQALKTVVLYVVVQQLENNLIVPKVMQRAVSIHPLAVMVALLAGGELLGVTGAILSVPVAAAIAVILDEVRGSYAGTLAAGLGPASLSTQAASATGVAVPNVPGDGHKP